MGIVARRGLCRIRQRRNAAMKFPMLASALGLLLSFTLQARAEDLAPEYRQAVDKGLSWVAKNQQADGHWEANGGHYPISMTALGGMVLLMEGSTIREGKYC